MKLTLLFGGILIMQMFLGTDGAFKIGAFQTNSFGKALMSKPDIVQIYIKIVKRYGLILLQEIRDSSNTSIHQFMDQLEAATGINYELRLSNRLGTTSYKEQYAFIYRPGLLSFLEFYQYDAALTYEFFERPPYAVKFQRLPASRPGLGNITFIGIHVKPDKAVQEIDKLVDVYDEISARMQDPNAVIFGNFDADCNYVRVADWPNIRLRNQDRFRWTIGDEVDTATHNTHCAYDRLVTAGPRRFGCFTYCGVFNFQTAFGLTQDQATAVSDHFPVECLFRE